MRPLFQPFAALILWQLLAALLFTLALSTSLVAEVAPNADGLTSNGEPQHAIVTSPGAPVRSGPGDSFYLTDTLPEDTEVEVYKRQDDGWCAIRPPADSFSWVFAQHVQMVEGDGSMNSNVAEIAKDKVAARVGSRLGSQRDVVQVRMKQGERVQVLGRDDREGAAWYKIAPPAGEFRWIHARDIGLSDGGLSEVGPGDGGPGDEVPQTTDKRADGTVTLAEYLSGQPNTVAAPPLSKPESTAAAPAPVNNDANNEWSPAKTAPPPTDVTPVASAPPSTAELAAQLQELELRLSRMIAESPATWNIAPLEQSAEQLLARADSIQDRNAVKSTLAKIDRFSSIQRRYTGANSAAATPFASLPGNQSPGIAGPGAVTPNSIAPTAATPIAGATSSSPYDAVGTLRPVVSRRPGAPQFALVNAQGQVVTFITPTPDVNLQLFIGQQIGVTGSRGYIPEFRRAHVTAARVAPLNERMIR